MQIIHCPTKELFEKAQQYFFDRGIDWSYGGKIMQDYWDEYKEDFCLFQEGSTITRQTIHYAKKECSHIPITEAEDLFRFESPIYRVDWATTPNQGNWLWEYYGEFKQPNKPNLKTMLNNFMKKMLDKDTQTLIKAEYINGDLLLTSKGKEALDSLVFQANKAELVKMAQEELDEKKA